MSGTGLPRRIASLAPGGWLRYLEGAPGPAISYLMVNGGGLRAGWPVTIADEPANARYDLDALFPELAEGAPVLPPPYVVAGASRGYRATPMARDSAGNDEPHGREHC